MMKHWMWILAIACTAWVCPAMAQTETPPADEPAVVADEPSKVEAAVEVTATGRVTVSSRGMDVRRVLYDMFTQANKNFVLEPAVRVELFLSLRDIDFEEALMAVCHVANLQYDIQNGIYFISRRRNPPPAATPRPATPAPVAAQAPAPKPLGTLTGAELQATRLTVRFARTDLREVLRSFSEQTGIKVEATSRVPNWKLDVVLLDTSLLFALDNVTRAAGLEWRKTNMRTIVVDKPASRS